MNQDTGLSNRMRTKLATLPPSSVFTAQQPDGLIRLNQAENHLLRPELLKICKDAIAEELTEDSFSYPKGFGGDPKLLDALSSFFNNYFHPSFPVEAEHISTAAGSGNSLDALLCSICDDDDIVLTPGPVWNGFSLLAKLHASVTILPAPSPDFRNSFTADCIARLITTYDAAPDKSRIKALLICNPHNPGDQVYPASVLRDLMNFAHERGLHYISDEVSALSAFNSPETPFVSALSLLNKEGKGISRSRVHVLWSASKDFGSPGMRMACVVSQANKPLLAGVTFSSWWQTSVLSSIYFTAVLTSRDLPALVKLNQTRLRDAYGMITTALKEWDIEYVPVHAGMLIFVRVAKNATTWEEEAEMIEKLKEEGVLLVSGKNYGYGDIDGKKGWARMLFALQEDILKETIRRMGKVLTTAA